MAPIRLTAFLLAYGSASGSADDRERDQLARIARLDQIERDFQRDTHALQRH